MHHSDDDDRSEEFALRLMLSHTTGNRDTKVHLIGEIVESGGCTACTVDVAFDMLFDMLDRHVPGGAIAVIEANLTALLDREHAPPS